MKPAQEPLRGVITAWALTDLQWRNQSRAYHCIKELRRKGLYVLDQPVQRVTSPTASCLSSAPRPPSLGGKHPTD